MTGFTFTELTPTSFLRRAAEVYGERTAIVDGDRRTSYREFWARALALTGVLADAGVGPGDRVAVLAANSQLMLELHHGVPLRTAVLVPLNIRLSAPELVQLLRHSGSSLLFATAEFAELARAIGAECSIRVVVSGADGEYEERLAAARPDPVPCADERGLLGINYTSGTTGTPRGVMVHHRGAYLQSLAHAVHTGMDTTSSYLWTLPMFHCNGWCLTWGVTAVGGTHVCLPRIDAERIWELLRAEGVTHLSAAPSVLAMIASAPGAEGPALGQRVAVQTGGAPPSPALLARLERLGMNVTHLYGLTETFGPIAINEWQPQWDELGAERQALLRARQGVGNVIAEPLRVVDAAGADVPRDGADVGEIVVRGNDVMLGYYRDPESTAAAQLGGWFRTGDLAVHHPDGYVEITDRAKDLIISGGENIASVEVERAIEEHPGVLECAVVGMPDPRWGEVPVVFVATRQDAALTPEEITTQVRARLASFKVPKRVEFTELPKTSTGKIHKQSLRERLAGDGS